MARLIVYADFNERTDEGRFYLLYINDTDINDVISDELYVGREVSLCEYGDEDGFVLPATLERAFSEFLGRDIWVANAHLADQS